jgi:hypothetical protein
MKKKINNKKTNSKIKMEFDLRRRQGVITINNKKQTIKIYDFSINYIREASHSFCKIASDTLINIEISCLEKKKR